MRFALDSLLLACFAHREFEAQAPHALKNPLRQSLLPPSLQAESPSCHLAGELGTGAGSSLIGLLLLNPRLAGLGFELVPELVEAAGPQSGMDITFVTSSNDNKAAKELLIALGMPFVGRN